MYLLLVFSFYVFSVVYFLTRSLFLFKISLNPHSHKQRRKYNNISPITLLFLMAREPFFLFSELLIFQNSSSEHSGTHSSLSLSLILLEAIL